MRDFISSRMNYPDDELVPGPPDSFDDEPVNNDKAITLHPIFNGEEFRKIVNYPIVVELYEKVIRGGGRRKRAYLETFTESERKLISQYHTKFYRWYLVTGTPKRVGMRLRTLDVLRRAVHFFATI